MITPSTDDGEYVDETRLKSHIRVGNLPGEPWGHWQPGYPRNKRFDENLLTKWLLPSLYRDFLTSILEAAGLVAVKTDEVGWVAIAQVIDHRRCPDNQIVVSIARRRACQPPFY